MLFTLFTPQLFKQFLSILEQQVAVIPDPSVVAEMPADDGVLTPEARTLIGVALFSLIDAAAITLKQYLKRKFGFWTVSQSILGPIVR